MADSHRDHCQRPSDGDARVVWERGSTTTASSRSPKRAPRTLGCEDVDGAAASLGGHRSLFLLRRGGGLDPAEVRAQPDRASFPTTATMKRPGARRLAADAPAGVRARRLKQGRATGRPVHDVLPSSRPRRALRAAERTLPGRARSGSDFT